MDLVVGGDGLIGRALTQRLGGHFVATTRRPAKSGRIFLDLNDVFALDLPRVSVAYIAAGMGRPECEADPLLARRVNVDGTVALAAYLIERGAYVIFPSSAAVFSEGDRPKPTDATSPISVYGRLKVETERQLLALGNCAILRLSKVIAPDAGLLARWQSDYATDRPILAYDHTRIAPVSVGNAADVLIALGATKPGGIHHMSASKSISWATLASALFGPSRVTPISKPPGMGQDVTVLDTRSLERVVGHRPVGPLADVPCLVSAE